MAKLKKGIRLATGEIEILEMLWRMGSATLLQAHESLPRKVGYTTVQTRLNRLVRKGLVRKTGSHPASYQAAIPREEVCRQDLDLLVEHVANGRVVPLVAHLVKDRHLSEEEIDALKRLIDEADRANRKPKGKENQS
jgi:predicted transcriptional regulator